MAQTINKLTVKAIPSKLPGLHHDGHGLYLRVTQSKTRSWMFRYTKQHEAHSLGLGPYPEVPLADARQTALALRKQVREGGDPLQDRRAARAAAIASHLPAEIHTFKECAEMYIEAQKPGWSNPKHAAQWASTLQTYVYPVIGSKSVSEIDTAIILKILTPIWTAKTETARRVRGRIEAVLSWAAALGWRNRENPAQWRGHLDKLLVAPKTVTPVKNFPALPWAESFSFMLKLQGRDGIAASSLKFLILTAARTNEVIGAQWDEIDFDACCWTVPAERMKGRKGKRKPHRKPLSPDAVALLKSIPKIAGEPFIFSGARATGTLCANALEEVLQRMRRDDITVHGFRSTFRDWAAETTEYPNELVEMALAHAIRDKAEAAYRRGDMLERRRPLMNQWGCVLSGHCGRIRQRRGNANEIRNRLKKTIGVFVVTMK